MEGRCRVILELIFSKKFPRTKPFKPQSLLEIDCYNNEMKLGLEYDGYLHHTADNHLHSILNDTQERDKKKDELCRLHGITLIRVKDYETSRVTLVDVIVSKLKEAGVSHPLLSSDTLDHFRVPSDPIYGSVYGNFYLDQLRKKLKKHRCTLLSDYWSGIDFDYDAMCSRGHRFKTSFRFTSNHPCRKCREGGNKNKTKIIEEKDSKGDSVSDIFFSMLTADCPLKLTEISERSGLSIQLVHHHLPNMIKSGLIVPVSLDEQVYYSVQMVFLNDGLFKKLSKAIIPVIKIISENISYEFCDDKEEGIRNCLIMYVMAITREIK